jgi:cysteinyl-tRNA synthetase
MSKSLGNFVTVRQLLDEGYDPASIRHQLLSAHYRSDLNFTRAGLDASRSAVQRLVDFDARMASVPVGGGGATELPRLATEALDAFRTAMDNDFNTADALAALFGLMNRVNTQLDTRAPVPAQDVKAVRDAVASMDRVLGLLEVARASRSVDDSVAAWVEERIQARADARKRKDFAAADAIRKEITERGIVLEDGPSGTKWKVTDASAAKSS